MQFLKFEGNFCIRLQGNDGIEYMEEFLFLTHTILHLVIQIIYYIINFNKCNILHSMLLSIIKFIYIDWNFLIKYLLAE